MKANEVLNCNKQNYVGRWVKVSLEMSGKKRPMWDICPYMGGRDKYFRSDTDKLKVFRKMISKGTRNLVAVECLVWEEIMAMIVV